MNLVLLIEGAPFPIPDATIPQVGSGSGSRGSGSRLRRRRAGRSTAGAQCRRLDLVFWW